MDFKNAVIIKVYETEYEVYRCNEKWIIIPETLELFSNNEYTIAEMIKNRKETWIKKIYIEFL